MLADLYTGKQSKALKSKEINILVEKKKAGKDSKQSEYFHQDDSRQVSNYRHNDRCSMICGRCKGSRS